MITYFNSFAENWMAYFGTAILQNTLFLGVIFLVLYLLRERDARIRYAVAAFGLIKLLVPPFVPFTVRETTSAIVPTVGTIELGPVAVGTEAAPSGPSLSILGIILLIWAATALFMLGSTLFSTLRLKWHLRASTFVKHTDIDGKAIDVYCSPNISVPMSIGLFPKRVYVPILWSSLSDDLQHSLLRHEVAHIKRKDGLLGALQILAQAIYFFHPLVWILTRQADELREMACDDMAVDNSEVTPLVYSRCLVHVAEHMLPSWSCSSASTLMKQKNKLYSRVNYQVKETNMNKLTKNRSRLIWTLLLVLVVPLSWYCKQPDATVGLKNNEIVKIYGTVTDQETGKPLAGANIYMQGTNRGATTNMKGEYSFMSQKPVRNDIVCSYIGYEKNGERHHWKPGKKLYKLDFEMKPSSINAPKVVVNANKPMTPSAPAAPSEEIVKFDTGPKPVDGFEAISKAVKYPASAKKAGLECKIMVSIFIDENGVVTAHKIKESISIASNNNSFVPDTKAMGDCESAAVNALSSLKWIPAMKNQKPLGVWVTLPVTFRLPDKQGATQMKVEGEKTPVEFIPYDTPPFPVGGQAALAENIQYPELAKKAGIVGTVVVQAKIALDGTVADAIILNGMPNTGLNEAAIDAIKKTKWVPAKQRDKDMAVWVTIPVQFKLDEKE
ncbi:MAG: TonB family protein [Candidatus Marinimicrobia bacterium]|nr:TonB family protein [Candidatus Neomarinimicrobiota bacterium]